MAQMIEPLGVSTPYYIERFAAKDGSWSAKFIFVAANAWSGAQETWLADVLAEPTTYTYMIRHEPAASNTAPGALTMSIVGHTHLYRHNTGELVVGNGGAPLTSGSDYGYVMVIRNPDNTLTFTSYDYLTHDIVDVHRQSRWLGALAWSRARACCWGVSARSTTTRAPAAPPSARARIPAATKPQVNMVASGGRAVIPLVPSLSIDGEWIEPGWNTLAISGPFLDDDGGPARPVSQVRLLADPRDLVVGLYAADENIETSDHFDLTVGAITVAIDPHGTVTPALPGVRAAVDTDGTIDQPRDDDEEWVVEVGIPRAMLGDAATQDLPVRASRCDVTKDGVQRCGHWEGTLQLAPVPTGSPPQPPRESAANRAVTAALIDRRMASRGRQSSTGSRGCIGPSNGSSNAASKSVTPRVRTNTVLRLYGKKNIKNGKKFFTTTTSAAQMSRPTSL